MYDSSVGGLTGYWRYRGSSQLCFSGRCLALVLCFPTVTDKRRSKVELDQAEGVEVVSTAVQLEIDSLWFWAVAEIIRCPTFV